MRPITPGTTSNPDWADVAAFWLSVFLLTSVPLAFSTAVYRAFSLPKFALLLTGASALIPLLVLSAMRSQHRYASGRLLASRQVLLVFLLLLAIAISTVFGVSPVASLFGSSYNQMGLITVVCFVILFTSLILTIRSSETRLRLTLWAMTLTGLAVATYAFVQFFNRDPFLHPRLYTYASQGGPIVRITSTIGHSDYLGNFLLYIAPVGAGLALSSQGRARRIGFMAAGLSTLAIVFTGTRGAWLGLAVAALTFSMLTKSRVIARFAEQSQRRRIIRWGALAFVLFLVLSAMVAFNPASRSIVRRATSLVHDATGSGRTLLWRDSMKMIRQYAVIGCGPEGFRKAFLPYKSTALAHLAPNTNNESSHNSYIDAAVSYGLPGAILYVAIIASSLSLLIRARRRATAKTTRIIVESLVAALAAAAAHNFFIFDQISTGLYFFAFAALAQVANLVVYTEAAGQKAGVFEADGIAAVKDSAAVPAPDQDSERRPKDWVNITSLWFPLGAGCVLFCLAGWYSFHVVRADLAMNSAITAVSAGDLRGLLEHGNRGINRPDPAGDYRFMFARFLTLYADNSTPFGKSESMDGSFDNRAQAIELAMSLAAKSAVNTNTPDSNYVLLAYLALQLGHYEEVFGYASEAIKTDPNFSNSHWLMAEAHLGRDQRELAANQARFALDLNPNSSAARSALKRALGVPQSGKTEELIRYGQSLASKGKIKKALRILRRAVERSNGRCAECRSALASVYETANLYQEAISEWEAYALEAPERALAEKTALRIENLKREATLKR
jgi:O-antigen ligase